MNLENFCRKNGLPEAYADSARQFFLPFADWLEDRIGEHVGSAFVLGINGAQGTGKSTLAKLIHDQLSGGHGRNVVILSIDDIYLTHQERQSLGERIHPLLATRGVPGTHDVSLGVSVIEQLCSLQSGETTYVPRFDKAIDDRCPKDTWTTVSSPVDLVIFEGWCVGSQDVPDEDLLTPQNTLESDEDVDGRWRQYVNARLRTDYVKLFSLLNALLFLQAPGFDAVLRWRLQQEHRLRSSAGKDAAAIMSDDEVARFIQHYERITRDNISKLPSRSDAVIELAKDHSATSLRFATR